MDKKKGLILILLISLVVLIFIRTVTYIALDFDFLNLEKNFEPNQMKIIDQSLTVFSTTRMILVLAILYLRNFKNDLLNYLLYYLLFNYLIRSYYHLNYNTEYIIQHKDKAGLHELIDKYQDINTILQFLVSGCIIYKIFLM